VPKAFVVRAEEGGAELTEAEVRQFVKGKNCARSSM
jgi:hypothetical protein